MLYFLLLVIYSGVFHADPLHDLVTAAQRSHTARDFIEKSVGHGPREVLASLAANFGWTKPPQINKSENKLEVVIGKQRASLTVVSAKDGQFLLNGERLQVALGEPAWLRFLTVRNILSHPPTHAFWFSVLPLAYASEDPSQMAVAVTTAAFHIADEGLLVEGAPVAVVRKGLSSKCSSRLAEIESAAQTTEPPLKIQRLNCENGDSTFRMIDPFYGKSFTEVRVSRSEFHENIFPRSGTPRIDEEKTEHRAVGFTYPLDSNGEVDDIKLASYLGHLETHALGDRSWREQVANLYDYYMADHFHTPLPWEKNAKQRYDERVAKEAKERFGYKWGNGYYKAVGGNVAESGGYDLDIATLVERADRYRKLVQTARTNGVCGVCAQEFEKAAGGIEWGASLTAPTPGGPKLKGSDDDDGSSQ